MGMMKLSTVSLAILFILGCSSQSADPPGVVTPGVATPAPPAKTVFDPLTQQVERARAVQKTVDANADSTRQAIDSQERGDKQERGDSSP
jgi:PBP1b-binding outer membrane lipoprotein LpoB